MSSKFEHVVIIKESKDLSKLSISELTSSLHVHEQRIKTSSLHVQEQRMNWIMSTPSLNQVFQSKMNVKNTRR